MTSAVLGRSDEDRVGQRVESRGVRARVVDDHRLGSVRHGDDGSVRGRNGRVGVENEDLDLVRARLRDPELVGRRDEAGLVGTRRERD